MDTEVDNIKQKHSPKPIRIVKEKPEEILLRKRYDNESAKEYKYFLEKLWQYEVDVELYKIFLDNEEYKKIHGVDKPTGKQYISFQAPIEIFDAFKAQTEKDDCTQVSAFVKFMDQYGKGKQVKFADPIKKLENEVKKLKKELANNGNAKETTEEKIVNTVQAIPVPIPAFLEKVLRDEIDSLKKTNSQLKVDKYKSDKVMLKFNSISTVFSFTESETLDYLEKLISSKKSQNSVGGN